MGIWRPAQSAQQSCYAGPSQWAPLLLSKRSSQAKVSPFWVPLLGAGSKLCPPSPVSLLLKMNSESRTILQYLSTLASEDASLGPSSPSKGCFISQLNRVVYTCIFISLLLIVVSTHTDCSPLPLPWTWSCPETSGLGLNWPIEALLKQIITPLLLKTLHIWPLLLLPTSQGSAFSSLMYILFSPWMVSLTSRTLNTSRHSRISNPHLYPRSFP